MKQYRTATIPPFPAESGESPMPQLHDAFTYLVYPFCHTLSAADRMERLTALNRN